MKWLSIADKPLWGLRAGQVFDDPQQYKCCADNDDTLFLGVAHPTRRGYFRCESCWAKVPWGAAPKRYFSPIDPEKLGVTEEEANKLYDTTPDKEKVT